MASGLAAARAAVADEAVQRVLRQRPAEGTSDEREDERHGLHRKPPGLSGQPPGLKRSTSSVFALA